MARSGPGSTLEQRIGRQQRSVGVIDLVGLRVEQVQRVKLDTPAVVEAVADAAVEDAPAVAIVTTKLPDEAVASVMPEQGQKENDRNRNAKKPKQDSAAKTHDNLLLIGSANCRDAQQ
jgi:hypothetical protein